MKKLIFTFLVIVSMCLTFVGCGKEPAVGHDIVENARNAYAKLDSGRLVATDINTGELVQEFIFMYNKDKMIYSYENNLYTQPFYEYNQGDTLYLQQDGDIRKYNNGEFKAYTRKEPHDHATQEILFYIPNVIKSSEMTEEDGVYTIYYEYDENKFNGGKVEMEDGEKLSGFNTTYKIDKNGKILELIEKTVYSYGEETKEYGYKVNIYDENQITEIPNKLADKI